MQFPSFHVSGNLFFIFLSVSHVFCPSPAFYFIFPRLGFEFDMNIATSQALYYSVWVEWEEEGSPYVSDVETGYFIEFGPPQRKRNASHGHQITDNWG